MKFLKLKFVIVIFLTTLPLSLFAQVFSEEVASVEWLSPTSTDRQITVNGRMITVSDNPENYRFKLEYGYPGISVTEGSNSSIGLPDVIAFIPQGMPLSSVPTTGGTFLNPEDNSFSFNIWSLRPSEYYYFNIHECNYAGDACRAMLNNYFVARTQPPENISINLSPFQDNSTNLSVSMNNGTNLFGMNVSVYLTTSPAANPDVPEGDSAVQAFSTTLGAGGMFSVYIPNLSLNQQYYLHIVNATSGLALLSNIPVIFNEQNTPPVTTDTGGGNNQTGGNGGNNSLNSNQQDFSSGIINCDGVNVPCTFEKLLLLINRVVNFVIYVICVPILALVFAYAGVLMVTSGGNPAKKDDAKSIIGKAVTGFILLLAAWILVKTLLLVFGYSGPILTVLGI